MPTLKRTNSEDSDFMKLVKLLDLDLEIRDGDDHEFYDQFNGLDKIKDCVVAYKNNVAVGCGAIRHYDKIPWKLNECLS